MSTIHTWPSTRDFHPVSFTWGVRDNSRSFVSELSGAMQTMSLPGTRWAVLMEINNQAPDARARVEGFLTRIRQANRIEMHRLDRPRPIGTIALNGVTLAATASAFASTVSLSGCGASTTMQAGSMIGIGGQLLMVAQDATANGSGQMTVQLTHALRAQHPSGSPVVLSRPTAKWILKSGDIDFPRYKTIATPLALELVEAF
jgi:hypothetical protein